MSALPTTVVHAVAFLTRPLVDVYPANTLAKLQLVLEANLTALYAPSWEPAQPLKGSGRRCLTLSPDCLPPRAVYAACIAAAVQWFDWIALLGNCQFDLYVDPGCVAIRLNSQLISIWSADEQQQQPSMLGVPTRQERKTAAQQLLEDDAESDEQIFAMIADEIGAPTWVTPVVADFPKHQLQMPRTLSNHSRSSSRSSTSSSSGFSFSSGDCSSRTSSSGDESTSPQQLPKQSRRERARQARVYVDASKNEVTPYDGGKTTVLTGAVMLGCAPKKPTPASPPAAAYLRPQIPLSWRSAPFTPMRI
ncbi:product biotin synthase [Favolaschia claudopus]|uniref:Product biotin synthase n=1 Tax=Favolaschia claudopus TaxID=2862362 RepID=A0AAW0EIC0_9AGAR